MSEFLAMGGYGAYVWTAYGVTALALALLFVWSWLGARARETELEQVRKLSRAERQAPASATLTAAVHGSPAAIDQGSGADSASPLTTGDAGSGAS